MKKLLHYNVVFADGTGIISAESKFEVNELNVIGENDINLVVDDLHFTTISKEKREYFTSLGVKSISISANDTVWGNRISYSLFTFEKKKAATIKREIEKEVDKRFGFFTRALDLSFIKEGEA